MKNTLLILLSFFSLLLNAQNCYKCSKTISGTETLPQIVPKNTTLCILPSGKLNADLVIIGGLVCNFGTINDSSIAITSGELINSGQITAKNLAMTGGQFQNNAQATINQTAVTGIYMSLTNNGTYTGDYFAATKLGLGSNPIVNNGGKVTVKTLALNGADLTNTSDLTVTEDFANNDSTGNVINDGAMSIGRHFANTGKFYTSCMIDVGGDFANAGFITGPATTGSCGGFKVVGNAANTGEYGITGNLDMCTATTMGGFHANTGVVGTNVTNCICTNACNSLLSVYDNNVNSKEYTLFPNPTNGKASLSMKHDLKETHSLQIYDIHGKQVQLIQNITSATIALDFKDFSSGVYFLQLYSNSSIVFSERLVIY